MRDPITNNDLSLGTKQKIGFGIVLLLMAVVNIFTIFQMTSLKSEIDEVSNNRLPRAIAIADLNYNTAQLRINQLEHVYIFDEEGKRRQALETINLIDDINRNLDIYDSLKKEAEKIDLYPPREDMLYQDFDDRWDEYQSLSFEFFELSNNNDKQEAIDLLNGRAQIIFSEMGTLLHSLVDMNETESFEASLRAGRTVRSTFNIIVLLLIITIVAAIIITNKLVGNVIAPIKKLQKAAASVANGDLNTKVDIKIKDELGLLGDSFNDMINSLREAREKDAKQSKELLKQQTELTVKNKELAEKSESLSRQKNEIEKKNDELESTMHKLKEAQNQLVQSEKLASLGQLTAGIAHEINNPVNFITANIRPLKRDIDDVLKLIRRYDSIITEFNYHQQFSKINNMKEEIEYEFLLEEMNNLIKGIIEGANRTADIVKGLRNFSRLDEDDKKLADINEGLETTLMMLRNEFKNRIKVVKNFGDIPKIICYPGKLNQVFMNVLSNAGHAIKDKGTITITTSVFNNYLILEVMDDGSGMTDEVKNRIFEPFFTTKDVGKGTGLGMSITYGIIKDHNGIIDIESEIGKGTKFIIKLPIVE